MIRCPECGAVAWNQSAMENHIYKAHWLPDLKEQVLQGRVSDWPQQAPTHPQVMCLDQYSYHLIPWQDEILAILWRSYDGGQAA